MFKYFAAYLTMIVAMAALDFLWIGFIAKQFYQTGIGHLMAEKPNLMAAATFYLVFCAGLLWFCIVPLQQKPSLIPAITSAAVFGLCAYATYDLSNLATLKSWPVSVALVDIAWGIFASVIAVALGKTVFDFISAR
jgi:uncharacterized membrane protein